MTDERRGWLDANAEEKNSYSRRERGLDDPVEKEDVMTRILAEVEDQFVDDFTADLLKRPSGFGSAVGQMFEGTTLPEVIAKIGELYPGLFEKAATLTAKAEPGKSDASF